MTGSALTALDPMGSGEEQNRPSAVFMGPRWRCVARSDWMGWELVTKIFVSVAVRTQVSKTLGGMCMKSSRSRMLRPREAMAWPIRSAMLVLLGAERHFQRGCRCQEQFGLVLHMSQ